MSRYLPVAARIRGKRNDLGVNLRSSTVYSYSTNRSDDQRSTIMYMMRSRGMPWCLRRARLSAPRINVRVLSNQFVPTNPISCMFLSFLAAGSWWANNMCYKTVSPKVSDVDQPEIYDCSLSSPLNILLTLFVSQSVNG